MFNERQNLKLVAIDVDGTLSSAGGPMEAGDIKAIAEKNIMWGILSSRSKGRAMEACQQMGIAPAFCETCRVDMRAEELTELAKRYKANEYIYIADRDVDYREAKRAGWRFIFAPKFREASL